MRLSPNFTLRELTDSLTATRLGIDNSVSDPSVIENLRAIATAILQPIRHQFGAYTPESTYRCEALNKAVGGASTSQHRLGQAADIILPNVSPMELAKWCALNLKDFDQIILEPTWVHISFRRNGGNRKQILRATVKGGKMVYRPWKP